MFRRGGGLLPRSRDVPISKLALQFSSQNPEIPTTLFSSARAEESVQRNVAWHEEPCAWALGPRCRNSCNP